MIELKVKGMSCQHCVKAVREALSSVPGVIRVVSVDLDSGHARVEGDAEPGALASAVAEAGYGADVVQCRSVDPTSAEIKKTPH